MTFDWVGLQHSLQSDIVRAVRDHASEGTPYGVAVFGFYSDGTVIAWPMIGVAFDGSDEAHDLERRWNPHDWDTAIESSDIGDEWSSRLSTFATTDRGKRWDAAEKRFERAVVAACKAARKLLIADGLIPKSALVVAIDEGEELVPRCLTRSQVIREFPHLDAEAAERRRVAELPVGERIAALHDAIGSDDDGPLDWESAPPLLYDVARTDRTPVVDALLHRLLVAPGRGFGSRHLWISALSDLGADRNDVVAALTEVMLDRTSEGNVRSWAAATLCRFGRLALVASHVDALPVDGRRAFATPYASPLPDRPIDFAPLEAVLATHPDLDELLLSEMGINHEAVGPRVEVLFGALASPWPCIRSHAAWSLVFARLTPEQENRYRQALDVLTNDPSPAISGRVVDLREIVERDWR